MLLAYNELCELVEQGVIRDVPMTAVNGSSINLRLGPKILAEEPAPLFGAKDWIIDVASGQPINVKELATPFILKPDAFVLGHTIEGFNLPDTISAQYHLRSSLGRIGLEHLNAGWCDPGWTGSVLTLELKNITQYHFLRLTEGCPIGQLTFFKHEAVPNNISYRNRGRYNFDKTVSTSKEI